MLFMWFSFFWWQLNLSCLIIIYISLLHSTLIVELVEMVWSSLSDLSAVLYSFQWFLCHSKCLLIYDDRICTVLIIRILKAIWDRKTFNCAVRRAPIKNLYFLWIAYNPANCEWLNINSCTIALCSLMFNQFLYWFKT